MQRNKLCESRNVLYYNVFKSEINCPTIFLSIYFALMIVKGKSIYNFTVFIWNFSWFSKYGNFLHLMDDKI